MVKIMIVQHRYKQDNNQGQDLDDVNVPYVQEFKDDDEENQGESQKNPEADKEKDDEDQIKEADQDE